MRPSERIRSCSSSARNRAAIFLWVEQEAARRPSLTYFDCTSCAYAPKISSSMRSETQGVTNRPPERSKPRLFSSSDEYGNAGLKCPKRPRTESTGISQILKSPRMWSILKASKYSDIFARRDFHHPKESPAIRFQS